MSELSKGKGSNVSTQKNKNFVVWRLHATKVFVFYYSEGYIRNFGFHTGDLFIEK